MDDQISEKSVVSYVSEKIRGNVPQEEIVGQLVAVGWSEEDARGAYREGLIAQGVPLPGAATGFSPQKKSSTGVIIINFFSFILLGIVATALGSLLFAIINHFFPDALRNDYYYQGASGAINYAIAALIIGFPLYYGAMRLWFRSFRDDAGRKEARLTQWLTYLVLLVTAVVVVGDLITVVYQMLQGELTMRFFLKALTILLIAGDIFMFYFLERKKVQYGKDIPRTTFQLFGLVVSAVVVVSVILGFIVSGSPSTQRAIGFDKERADDLSSLAGCVSNYASQFNALPTSLNALDENSQFSYCAGRTDPETGVAYSYQVTVPTRVNGAVTEGVFEMCADFTLRAEGTEPRGYSGRNSKWHKHEAGRACDSEVVVLSRNQN